jgi:hypothetical protein
MSLLSHPTAGHWVAYTALERGILREFQRARCLSVIRPIAGGNDLAGVGARA